jgi:hypothetical protein
MAATDELREEVGRRYAKAATGAGCGCGDGGCCSDGEFGSELYDISQRAELPAGLQAAGLDQVSVEFTHEVADGMHGAIVKAVKT